ncbi:TetR/AcrR family transcriptional regulator [Litoreibacter albidus]|uniref:Transcriptional regulator, TetR family n=1 Tax=Litoreibacter albidus TaxID=670155 RepID=A0A1H3AYJ6_9RHOB|nr:TetR/AcrR family transcriptional regulator [Litoreibacter albidus]SDX33889.1 transcriptional regulator, TetR family [Litoreibacter albidus]
MKRPTHDAIKDKIRRGLVRVVAQKGIGGTSIGAVAKEAGVSAGTIYLHFADKSDLLQQVYLHIKSEFHAAIVAAAEEADSKAMIERMWRDMLAFTTAQPLDFLFIEYAGAAQVLNPEQAKQVLGFQDDITAMLQRAIDDGTVAQIPVETIVTLLVAPAMHLARVSALHNKPTPAAQIDLTFERVWMSIAGPNPSSSPHN